VAQGLDAWFPHGSKRPFADQTGLIPTRPTLGLAAAAWKYTPGCCRRSNKACVYASSSANIRIADYLAKWIKGSIVAVPDRLND